MSSNSGPFARPVTQTDPGVGRLVVLMMGVGVLGLVVIGLVYLSGDPVDGVAAIQPADSGRAPTAQADSTDASKAPPTHDEPYVVANGASPLPGHGEEAVRPIPPKRLVTQKKYDAPPPKLSTLPTPDGPVAWTEASKYLGQTITVKGTIVDTKNIGQICFLNYDPNRQDKFYIAMFKEAFDLLPDPPEEHYLNRTLLVTGKVTLHKDRPQIEVHDVSQIEVLE